MTEQVQPREAGPELHLTLFLSGALTVTSLAACGAAHSPGARYSVQDPAGAEPPRTESQLLARFEGVGPSDVLHGKATYYSNAYTGRKTANGDVYDPKQFTAAHRTLPFNTVVRVVHLESGRYIYARVNDRGPFGNSERIIDLSYIAAERLGMLRAGVVRVRVEVLP